MRNLMVEHDGLLGATGLVKNMTVGQMVATLEMFGEAGVTAEDLKFLRRYKGHFRKVVVARIRSGTARFENAIGPDIDRAVKAIKLTRDPDILNGIISAAEDVAVKVVAVKRLGRIARITVDRHEQEVIQMELYDVARGCSGMYRELREAAARELDDLHLGMLIGASDDGYAHNPDMKKFATELLKAR